VKALDFINKSYEDLMRLAKEKHEEYITAEPFPNIYIDGLFQESFLNQVLEDFPDLSKGKGDKRYNDDNQVKMASKGESRFTDNVKSLMHYLNSEPFLDFLSELTGIQALIPDPYFEGGGMHQIKSGGYLNIHADFNKHKITNLDRRLNVLLYLNKDWTDAYGGHFELWDTQMKGCVKKILPIFNRMAIFTTTDYSYHGLPNPLTCPPDRSRKSLALFYYTNGRPAEDINPALGKHSTLFKQRAGLDTKNKRPKSNPIKKLLSIFKM
jgi:Rps23 Pro-64 3,4-dihydroxylase Tpa1-like proline 4-hydroxylase